MDDDDAFVRTIQDRPTELLPRLVYADWLDERDDPRGEYLRACCDIVALFQRIVELSPTIPGEWRDRVDPLFSKLRAFRMPMIGDSIPSAQVTRIRIRLGERVKRDQDFIDIETDKAAMTITSGFVGVVIAIPVKLGEAIPIGATIALILED